MPIGSRIPTASRSHVSHAMSPRSGSVPTTSRAIAKATALEDEGAGVQPHHPAQRRRRQLRRDEVPVTEQHGGVHRAQHQRRDEQLHREQGGAPYRLRGPASSARPGPRRWRRPARTVASGVRGDDVGQAPRRKGEDQGCRSSPVVPAGVIGGRLRSLTTQDDRTGQDEPCHQHPEPVVVPPGPQPPDDEQRPGAERGPEDPIHEREAPRSTPAGVYRWPSCRPRRARHAGRRGCGHDIPRSRYRRLRRHR